MKYIIPLALMLAPLNPYIDITPFVGVSVFAVGMFFGIIAYSVEDSPLFIGAYHGK